MWRVLLPDPRVEVPTSPGGMTRGGSLPVAGDVHSAISQSLAASITTSRLGGI